MKAKILSLKTTIKELDFLKINNYLLLVANKLIKSISDLRNAKEHYQSFIIVEKVDSNSSLYSDIKKRNFLNEKNIKITKREHAFKGYASTNNNEILNSFNPELQLKDKESAIKSKLIELLTQLEDFKFLTTLF